MGSLSLTSLKDSDLPLLFKWRNNDAFLRNLTGRNASKSFDLFVEELNHDFLLDRYLQFMICHNGVPAGTVYSYLFNKNDGYCFLSVYIDTPYRKQGYGAKAVIVLCQYLFTNRDLFKVYLDVYEYNQEVTNLLDRVAALEGRFKHQHILDGQRFDVLRYAIYSSSCTHFFKPSSIKVIEEQ